MTGFDMLSLVAFVAVTGCAAVPGLIFRPGDWYRRLAKPHWCPPDWLFGPAWLAIYLSIAVSGWLLWQREGTAATVPLGIFALQLLLNGLWSTIFFGLRRPGVAFFEVLCLLVAILANIASFYPLRPTSALLLVPYAVWVAFAAALNWKVWRLNPERSSWTAR